MTSSNGHRHRLRRIEEQRAAPVDAEEEDAERWRTAWSEAAECIIGTMAPVHIAGMAKGPEAHGPWERLRIEVRSRIGAKVGYDADGAPRYPDSPLALVPAVAEAILADPPNLRSDGLRCVACGYLLPSAGENVAIERDDDGGWYYRDSGEPCSEPVLPNVAVNERGLWRRIVLFSACPLCEGDELVSAVNDRAPQEARV